jgi:hypothetical protein
VIVSALILGGGIYGIYLGYQKQKEAATPKVIVIGPSNKPATLPKATSIFDQNADNAQLRAQRAATQKAAAPVAPPLPRPTAEMVNVKPDMEGAPVDIKTGDADWDAVEEARRMSNSSGDQRETSLAVVKFYDYKERFAGKNDKAIDAYLDEAADALWWKRIAELFEERDAAQKEIADRKLQITQSQDANFKKDLEAEIAKWAEQRDRADESLRIQMKFTRQAPPNLYDSQDRAALRSERDPEQFAKWKANVLNAIRTSRGQRLPWRGSR